ncbi:MAG: DNA-3-methyladenine glycosylase 2 family protein [Bacteroidetes bacterium]|nr:MAG: DNA-3-methyladenine glycosylase 2 family protein [Bacteroidota bacterium]REK05788.1 MAG: DNA-3-methyladenine glycosylase 2 family protein [Bacteroidota bacterium]REK31907.1 MAG: DNA-3-methyladenine glycosylase 2 family protein [Bacteroidota bacterium]REK49972.1 MAG: DNA-3-methyladenine glycosylase 2 family protein [Bacteroidota bacterium]
MKYLYYLKKDKHLSTILNNHQAIRLKKWPNPTLRLCESITCQQLSVKAGQTIYSRFLALCKNDQPDAKSILKIKPEALRNAGLSASKASYIHNVCKFSIEHGLSENLIDSMDDETAIKYLTQIKGVGRWTAEMLLMFTFARPDLFSADDLGLQTAMRKIYNLCIQDPKKFKERIIRISENWKPYRTYACMHLWKYLDESRKKS